MSTAPESTSHSLATETAGASGQWPRSFDIFCRVIDNYGDIGVCWRLAQQLARHPGGFRVRLWVDDLQRCRSLVPETDASLPYQTVRQVELVHWTDAPPPCEPRDVVIEAFACDPPGDFLRKMTQANAWINLEYLSAEDWVEGCHGLGSPQEISASPLQGDGTIHGAAMPAEAVPRKKLVLKKRFFFPGFTPGTGGLLREPDLLARRRAWLAQPSLRWQLLRDLGVSSDAIARLRQDALQVLLFCYPHAPAGQLLERLSAAHGQAVILLPEGVRADIPSAPPANIRIQRIPFVPQEHFDALLWSSDLNCIRGEDSLVRGLWAGRPLLWHIYAQDENAHLEKLDAWLARSPYPPDAQALMRNWNRQDGGASWPAFPSGDAWQAWKDSAGVWLETLSSMPDLVSSLLDMVRKEAACA